MGQHNWFWTLGISLLRRQGLLQRCCFARSTHRPSLRHCVPSSPVGASLQQDVTPSCGAVAFSSLIDTSLRRSYAIINLNFTRTDWRVSCMGVSASMITFSPPFDQHCMCSRWLLVAYQCLANCLALLFRLLAARPQ